MQHRDSFQKQQTGLLQKQVGTKPLGQNSTRPLVDPAALRLQAEEMIGKARESLEALEARIELLMHACDRGGLQVPGVTGVVYKHPLSPKGEQIVSYLANIFAEAGSPVARAVQVGVFRYHEAVAATQRVAEAVEGEALRPALLEELRLKLFYLTRYHSDFKMEKVLAQLFPPPQTVVPGASVPVPVAPISTAERLKIKAQREATLNKSEIFRASMKPKMEILDNTLSMLDNPKLNLGALFSPATRTARLLALGLGGNAEVVAKLRETRRLYDVLEQQLDAARKGGDVDVLKQTLYPLGRLALDCQKHPLLRELFPLGEQDLFPAEGPPADGAAPPAPPA